MPVTWRKFKHLPTGVVLLVQEHFVPSSEYQQVFDEEPPASEPAPAKRRGRPPKTQVAVDDSPPSEGADDAPDDF